MIWGLDYLGGAKFGDLILREHPEGWAAGFFANTFGNAWPVIERLLATGRCPRVRIHAIWDDAHTYDPRRHDRIIRTELERASALQRKFPNVDVQFSPFCEHNIDERQLSELYKKIGTTGPGVAFANSVWQGYVIPGALNEVHGTHRRPGGRYNYSFDGLSSVDADVEAIKRQYGDADTFYIWHPAFNGKLKLDDKTPRPQRKSWPTGELIDSLIYLHRECGDVKLPKNYLWKSHADRHNTPPEPRAYKPVLIAPSNAKRFELVAHNGQVIAVSSSSQPFVDGKRRYYFDAFGYQLAEKAKRIQGHSVVSLRADGKVVGSLNGAFRCGDFRA